MTNPKKVAACFEEAGFKFDITQFDHRLIAQKLVFLLEELGVQLGYRGTFNFYLRGTYSPTLTKDLFQAHEQDTDESNPALSNTDRAYVQKLTAAVELRPHVLEIMAAYRFLRNRGMTETEAIQKIKTTKPFISERDVAIGISKCKGIFPEITERDRAELEEEMSPWDAAYTDDAYAS